MVLAHNMCIAISHPVMLMTHQSKEKIHHRIKYHCQKLAADTKAKLLLVRDFLAGKVATCWNGYLNVNVFCQIGIQLIKKSKYGPTVSRKIVIHEVTQFKPREENKRHYVVLRHDYARDWDGLKLSIDIFVKHPKTDTYSLDKVHLGYVGRPKRCDLSRMIQQHKEYDCMRLMTFLLILASLIVPDIFMNCKISVFLKRQKI